MTIGTVYIAPGNLDGRRSFAVDVAADHDYLGALDHRFYELSAQRRLFVLTAYELVDRVLALDKLDEDYNTAMTSALNALKVVREWLPPTDAGCLTIPTGNGASDFVGATPKYTGDAVPRLPSWATRHDAGMPSEVWPDNTGIEAANPTHTEPQVTFDLSVLATVRAALLHLIDTLLAMARLCELEIRMVRHERSHILACIIGHPPDIRALVLAMIAVCRRYGHRSEPDHHASLLIRRHLVSMGSCPPI